MNHQPNLLRVAYWIFTAATFIACTLLMLWYAPVESQMGPVQKIFYVHLPTAINTFVAAFIVFIASVGYLWQRQAWWDDLAAAAGKVTALFCAIVLLTGMTWARSAWGMWWTWSPRLTFSLVLFLLFVVYLLIRPSIESPQRRAVVSAVYGVVAFLDVPLVYLSVKLMPDIHPSSITLEPAMKHTLWAWFVPVTLLMAGLIHANYRLNQMIRRREESQRALAAPPTASVGAGARGLGGVA
jgi:heme exporter protein C